MARMRTFLMYVLGILTFMFLSYILENGLIDNMYVKMAGIVETSENAYNMTIDNVIGKATNVNGFLNFTLTNNSNDSSNKYLKIELYNKKGTPSATKYVEITDLDAGASKDYRVKISGYELRNYKISVISESEVPDKTNIINVLGWEIDLSNVLGMDLTNARFMGVRIADIFNLNTIKSAGESGWHWTSGLLSSIPWWGYAIGAGIVFWYMPKGFLFGVFPL